MHCANDVSLRIDRRYRHGIPKMLRLTITVLMNFELQAVDVRAYEEIDPCINISYVNGELRQYFDVVIDHVEIIRVGSTTGVLAPAMPTEPTVAASCTPAANESFSGKKAIEVSSAQRDSSRRLYDTIGSSLFVLQIRREYYQVGTEHSLSEAEKVLLMHIILEGLAASSFILVSRA